MSEPVKIAFIGCGGIAGQHAKGYADLYKRGCRDLEYAACCDVNEANAKERAKEIAAIQGSEPKVFTDLKDLTESGVAEAADICSPHWLHHALAIQCLEGGLHVMVEKPIGITIKATKKIIEAGKKANRVVATAENIRRYQTCRAFRWAIAEKKIIGDVRFVDTRQVSMGLMNFDDYKFKWRGLKLLTGGGQIMDSGAHYADMMQHIFGDVDEVHCVMETFDRRIIENAPILGSKAADVEDAWIATILFKNGVKASWMYSRSFPGGAMKYARYYGSEGTMSDDKIVFHPFQGGGSAVLADGRKMTNEEIIAAYMASLPEEEKNRLFPYGCANGFGVQAWDFADAIRTGRKPEMDGADGLRSKALCEACYESATAGRAVKYDNVLSGKVCEYQKPIDEYWKI